MEVSSAVWSAGGLYKGERMWTQCDRSGKRRWLSAETSSWKRSLLRRKGMVFYSEGTTFSKGSGRKEHGTFGGLERGLVWLWGRV